VKKDKKLESEVKKEQENGNDDAGKLLLDFIHAL
jgi:hypothetical protein